MGTPLLSMNAEQLRKDTKVKKAQKKMYEEVMSTINYPGYTYRDVHKPKPVFGVTYLTYSGYYNGIPCEICGQVTKGTAMHPGWADPLDKSQLNTKAKCYGKAESDDEF